MTALKSALILCRNAGSMLNNFRLRGCLRDLALQGCNEVWDRFDVLKIGKSCGKCLSKIVSRRIF